MERRIARLGIVFTMLFMLLAGNLTYMQFIAASKLTARPENIRPILYEQKIKRGDIIDADGELLATSLKSGRGYKRHYPQAGLVAHITGFYSQKYGRAGLELTFDEYLSGQSKVSSVDDYVKRLLGKEAPESDLLLTINLKLQKKALAALGSKKGAIVALNPRTGAVLALASSPTFDPNSLEDTWESVSVDPNGVMVNRASQGKFTPGSSFKIITAATAVEDGLADTDTAFDAPAKLKIYGGTVINYGGKDHGKITLGEAFAKSVNTVFAQIGKDLGGKRLVESARAFGLGVDVPFDLATAKSRVPAASGMDELEVAWMAVGQGRLQVTPLSMALAAAAVANDGKIMRPYLVEKAIEYDGNIIFKRKPKEWLKPISKQTAEAVKTFMEDVVNEGSGKAAQIDSIRVAGKTGTAEVGRKSPHAWFVGFAPAENPEIVVAVIIENGGLGGKAAAPVAREIFVSALGKTN